MAHVPDTRIITVADAKCKAIVFMRPNGGAQVVITRPQFGNGEPHKPNTIDIPPPPIGQRIAILRYPDGAMEVIYRDSADVGE